MSGVATGAPEKQPLQLDLGCSFHKREGFIGLDILPAAGVDVIGDARRLPFRDDVFTEIYSSYALEHIDDQLAVISELWRVCRNRATIRLILPHFSNPSYYDDLTHQRLYSTRSFEHYDQDMHDLTGHPNYLPDVDLKLLKAEMRWWPPQVISRKSRGKRVILNLLNDAINYLANANQFLCERIWCRFTGGFYEVEYVLEVRK